MDMRGETCLKCFEGVRRVQCQRDSGEDGKKQDRVHLIYRTTR